MKNKIAFSVFFLFMFFFQGVNAELFGYGRTNEIERFGNITYINNTFVNETVNATINTTQFDSNNPISIKESWLTSFINNLVNGIYCKLTGCSMEGNFNLNGYQLFIDESSSLYTTDNGIVEIDANDFIVNSNLTANYLHGDGSQLTNLPTPNLDDYGKDVFCYYRAFTNFPEIASATGSLYGEYTQTVLNTGAFVGSGTQSYYASNPNFFTDIVSSMIFRSRAGTSADSGASVRAGSQAFFSNSTKVRYRTALLFQPSPTSTINANYAGENVSIRAGFSNGFGSALNLNADGNVFFLIEDGDIKTHVRQGGASPITTTLLTSKGGTPDFGFDEWLIFEINIDFSKNEAQFIVRNSSGTILANKTETNNHGGVLMAYGVKGQATPITSFATPIAHINFIDTEINKLSRFGLC